MPFNRPILPQKWKGFIVHIVFPAVLAVLFFVLAIFQVLIPTMERQLMDRKKEMIRELTSAAWSVLQEYHQEELSGRLTREVAQREAAARIEFMRYGEDEKDYYWITDMHPTMVVHPYRPDLNGQDLSELEDMRGKKLFVAFVEAVQANEADYVEYHWQWMDDPDRIVPKLSYVRAFPPWQWIIGTGIYTEDVREEIARTRQDLILISLAIAGTVSLLLTYIARQSLSIERRRTRAEQELKASNEKYRTLVEASTEGTMLILDGKCAYSNKTLQDMLGYEAGELSSLDVVHLIAVESDEDAQARDFVQSLLEAKPAPAQFEARLRRKDGPLIEVLLAATRVSYAGNNGFILIARDITRHKEMEAALDRTSRQFRTMTSALSLGVFRSTWGRKAVLVDTNPSLRRILGMDPDADLAGFDWLERIADPDQRGAFVAALTRDEVVENYRVGFLRADGQPLEASLFAVLINDENGFPRYCDVIMEDVTERRRAEVGRDALIAQQQTSLFFMQEPITPALRPAITCNMHTPIARAAEAMNLNQTNAMLVTEPGGEPIGIVTDHDFRERVVGEQGDTSRPVREIMSAPLVSISDHALVYEALARMQAKDISHLVVKDDSGCLKGILNHRDLIHYRNYSAVILANSIRHARSPDEIAEAHRSLPRLVKAMIDSGTKARHINRVIASVSDDIVERLVAMALDNLGPPPVRFSFLVLGSEGRQEQTLVTDQDNALLYEDPPAGQEKETAEYFLALGTLVCDWLNQVGIDYCLGGVMAKNQRWNQPYSAWKKHFSHWIHNADPQELLELNMLFDFRCVIGEVAFARDLRSWVFAELAAYPPFLLHFAQNALLYKPPLGLFGNILVESSAEGQKALNLKEAMMPFVNYARLYALKYQIHETHTLDRLAALHRRRLLSRESFDELVPAYEALMRLRLDRQAIALQENRKPSNSLSPQDWTPLEEAMLKRAFSVLSSLRKKISYDFLGSA